MAELMPSGNMCPIFPISCITKLGFPNLIDFIYKLEKRQTTTVDESKKQPFEFEINENFLVEDGAIWTKERSFDGFFIRNVATHVENLAASLNIGVVSYIGHQLIFSWSLTFLNIPCHGVLN